MNIRESGSRAPRSHPPPTLVKVASSTFASGGVRYSTSDSPFNNPSIRIAPARSVHHVFGPYGTGKKFTQAVTAGSLVKTNCTVIITAASNAVVAQVIDKIASIAGVEKRIVRLVSAAHTASPTKYDISRLLEELPRRLEDAKRPVMNARQRKQLASYNAHVTRIRRAEEGNGDCEDTLDEVANFEEELPLPTKMLAKMALQLYKPNIIGATVSTLYNATAKDGYLPSLQNENKLAIFVNESNRLLETYLMPLAERFPNANFTFFGDNKQLPPYCTLDEQAAAAFAEATCISERLMHSPAKIVELKTTYRCHPALNIIPNALFYDGDLKDGVTAKDRRFVLDRVRFPDIAAPNCCVLMDGQAEQSASSRSWLNKKEAAMAKHIVDYAIKKGVPPEKCAIITLYASQMRHLEEEHVIHPRVHVTTLDDIYGEVFELAVVCTTLTGAAHGNDKFFNDPRRVNASLIHARQGLYLLINEEAAKSSKIWSEVLSIYQQKKWVWTESQAYTNLS